MAVIKELVTKLSFQTDEAPLRRVEAAIDRIRIRLEMLAGYEMVKKFAQVSERFAAWGQELQVTAENIGMSVEELQKLQYAAEKSGVAGEELAHSMALLARHIYEARTQGGEALQVFNKIGISSSQVMNFKTTEEALYAVSDALMATNDPFKRSGASMELLGRGGFKLVAMMSQGSASIRAMGDELQKLGLVLSSKQVQTLTATEHSFQKLFHILKAIGAQVAAQVGPAFISFVDSFSKFYAANKELINLNITNFIHHFSFAMGYISGLFTFVARKYRELADRFGEKGMTLTLLTELAAAYVAVRIGIGLFGRFAKNIRLAAKAFEFLTSASKMWAALKNIFGFALAIVESLLLALAIGAVIFVLHDLYATSQGQKTWTQSIWDSLGPWEKMRYAIEVVKEAAKSLWDFFKDFGGWMGVAFYAAFVKPFVELADTLTKPFRDLLPILHEVYDLISNSKLGRMLWKGMGGVDPENLGDVAVRKREQDKNGEMPDFTHGGWNDVKRRARENTDAYYGHPTSAGKQEGDEGFVGPPSKDMASKLMTFLQGQNGSQPLMDRLGDLGSNAMQAMAQTFNVQGDQEITYNNQITINPPAGVSAKDIANHVGEAIKRSNEYEKTKTAQSLTSPADY